ncbi:MAG: hypothetical protein OXD54_06340 [Candidatus Poribacteria bacterium]|nr:hypothetical protein [Candidatus Poribacteria bacterium]
MRAVALSDNKIIEFLNENLINTWVSNVELKRTDVNKEYFPKRYPDDSKGYDTTLPFTQAIMKGWHQHSPVDCMVISADFELLGSLPINEFNDMSKSYHKFIQAALSGQNPGLNNKGNASRTTDWYAFFNSGKQVAVKKIPENKVARLNVELNPEHLSQHVMNIFRTPEHGCQDYTIVDIDTKAIEYGYMLNIDIQVGNAEPAGSFDLFDGDSEIPTEGIPHEALASVWDIPPGKTGTIRHRCENGQRFKLGATGNWFSEKGSVNAFYATITVEENQ